MLNARRHRHFLGYASVAILGLPGKIGNANISVVRRAGVRKTVIL